MRVRTGSYAIRTPLSRTRALVELENAHGRVTTTRTALERHIADAKIRYADEVAGVAGHIREVLIEEYREFVRREV